MLLEELRARLAATEYPFNWGIDKFTSRSETDVAGGDESDLEEDEQNGDATGHPIDDDKEEEHAEDPKSQERIIVDVYNRYCRCLAGFTFDLVKDNVDSAENCVARSLKYLEIDDPFVFEYRPAFLNIVWACCAHLSLERNNLKEAAQFLDKITPLDDKQQAAIWGTRCCILNLNGIEGKQEAGKYAMKAYECNKDEGMWSFLVGCNKADLRRFVYPLGFPSPEELEFLERACNLSSENAKYAAYLGRSYNDCGLVLYNKNMKDPEVENYNKKAYDLHRKAMELNNGESALVSLICARGFSRLPKKFNCLDEASKVMLEAFERSKVTGEVPMSLSYHYLGLLCLKKQQFEEAAEYLLKSSEFGCVEAAWAYIGVMLRSNPDFDPKDIYAKLLSHTFSKKLRKKLMIRTHVHAFCCYLLLKKDLLLAVEHFLLVADIVQSNPGIMLSHFEVFSQWVFKKFSKLNPLTVLCNEVKLAIELDQYSESRKVLEETLEKLGRIIPEELEKAPVHDLLEKLTLNENHSRSGDGWGYGGCNSGRGGGGVGGGRGRGRGLGGNLTRGVEHNRVRIRENRTRLSRFSESSSVSHTGYTINADRTRTRTKSESSNNHREPVTNWRTEDRNTSATNYNWNNYRLKQQNENWRQEDDGHIGDHHSVCQNNQDYEQ